jgi:N6-L-threonylcarbamoyladenine synthase
MLILGIESSCDETGLAIYDTTRGLISNTLFSQTQLHAPFGGVVPELASRNHVESLVPLLEQTLTQAQVTLKQLDAIAYTSGPGLIGALLTGACFAKSLAFSLNIPVLGVHHLEAHVLAAFLEPSDLAFPFLALLVSGGHTMLLEATALGQYNLLGETLDDAAGEAFDKTAKLLGLPYPGGPKLAVLADQYPRDVPLPFPDFPRPMCDRNNQNFSFSGLKTHALLTWQRSDQQPRAQQAIAFAFQEAVVDTLLFKCKQALLQTGQRRLVIAGGVGANQHLRLRLQAFMQSINGKVYFPAPELCTDNGAMVAYAGARYLEQGEKDADWAVLVKARKAMGSA